MKDWNYYTEKKMFCPGPTPVPMSFHLQAMMEEPLYHRSAEFHKKIKQIRETLGELFGSRDSLPLLLSASGTGAMEAAVTNFTAVGDQAAVLILGSFGKRWSEMLKAYGVEVFTLESKPGEIPSLLEFVAFLQSLPKTLKAFFLQANETSTAVALPLAVYLKALREHSKALIIVDGISAFGAHEVSMESMPIDCLVAGSQKGFAIPPGLSFICASERAWALLSSRPRFYFDLAKEKKAQDQGNTAWTSPISLILALEASLERIKAVGFSNFIQHHVGVSRAVRAALQAMGLELLAKANQSSAVTAFFVPAGLDAARLQGHLQERYQCQLAEGQESLKGKVLRVGHLGFMDVFYVLSGIASLELALFDLGYLKNPGLASQAYLASLKA